MRATIAGQIAALALSGLCLWAGAAHADPCQMGRVGSLDVTWNSNRATAPVTINGSTITAVIDTGASRSSLFRDAADNLHLAYSPVADRVAYGFGGGARIFSTAIHELSIAGETANYVHLDVIDAAWGGSPPIGMIIGENLLSSDDVELDFTSSHLNFFRTRGDCSRTALAYWSETWSAIDMLPREGLGSVMVNAKLNGQTVRALLDTGSYTSMVTLETARRLGVTPQDGSVEAAHATRGIGARRLQSWLGTFSRFEMGGETVNNPRLRIIDTHVPGNSHINFDMVLGADFFRTHRVMFAYSQNKVYFAYLGGHVFQIVGPAELPGEASGAGESRTSTPPVAAPSGASAPH